MSKVERNLVAFLKEGYAIKEVREEFKKRMSLEDFMRMQHMINKTVEREDFADYYLNGYGQFELVEMAGITKQRVAVIVGGQYKTQYTREEALTKYRENREKLVEVASWYAGVYRADQQGDLEPVIDCVPVPSQMNTLPILYETYKSLGGTKLEFTYDELDERYWSPTREENDIERQAVEMYLDGKDGHDIREKLGLDSDALFRCYKRAYRKKQYDEKRQQQDAE
ncbi:hypothetical protein [Bacillus thuringiensis]|uniref:hypothetical protein n=1 Tax=Bacillus thuringiensis TaxID=1428 RepID=UPI000BFCCD2A|nr:hypothetical protein [Bacillus thuringiensis]PGT89996.1 hypothetical protein COD17_09610 [Bacillus thuringiensis]